MRAAGEDPTETFELATAIFKECGAELYVPQAQAAANG
jgi:hypothetical protein